MLNRAWLLVLVLVPVMLSAVSCDGEITTRPVSFRDDIVPLFEPNCMPCHWSPLVGNGRVVDVTRVADLVNAPSIWDGGQPWLVVAGKPEESFLIDKISRTEFGPREGNAMPYGFERLSDENIAALGQWIANGARPDDPLFDARFDPSLYDGGVVPADPPSRYDAGAVRFLFGISRNLNGATLGRCSLCHGPGTPNLPNLANPFEPDGGAVNFLGPDGGPVIVPQQPQASRLYLKVLDPLPGGVGRAMPLSLPRLTEPQIELVRQWIREGAKDN